MQNLIYKETVQREIDEWKKRVFYPDLRFKDDTKADLEKLINHISKSKYGNFIMISSSSESSVYKITRFMVENGISNYDITFQDDNLMRAYINSNLQSWQSKNCCDEFFKIIGNKVHKKWLIIPEINISWSNELAVYFISKLQMLNCYGIVFYSPKSTPDSLAQVLCEETYMDILQFPVENFKMKINKKEIIDDEF